MWNLGVWVSICVWPSLVQILFGSSGESGFIFYDSILFGLIMSSSDSFGVCFTGKNYSAWEFQFRLFVTGKELWGQIDGSDPEPTEPKELAKWKVIKWEDSLTNSGR